MMHLAQQAGTSNLHPLLVERPVVKKILVVLITSDRGLAGAFNVNALRACFDYFQEDLNKIDFVTVGKKGYELLRSKDVKVVASFQDLPSPAAFSDVSPIGRLALNEFSSEAYDEVYLVYNEFHNILKQEPLVRRLLPLPVETEEEATEIGLSGHYKVKFEYEPDQQEILESIVPRFAMLQVYEAVLSSQASEHGARMVAMRNATDSANELVKVLQLEYNKARQQSITNEMLDIAGGAEAMAQAG
jgi:F-type H+-transporting ATPase subunit gamma